MCLLYGKSGNWDPPCSCDSRILSFIVHGESWLTCAMLDAPWHNCVCRHSTDTQYRTTKISAQSSACEYSGLVLRRLCALGIETHGNPATPWLVQRSWPTRFEILLSPVALLSQHWPHYTPQRVTVMAQLSVRSVYATIRCHRTTKGRLRRHVYSDKKDRWSHATTHTLGCPHCLSVNEVPGSVEHCGLHSIGKPAELEELFNQGVLMMSNFQRPLLKRGPGASD